MSRRLAVNRPEDEGAVALEFALVAPLLLLLVFAAMTFALYFAALVAVAHAATEGARATIGGLSPMEREQLAGARVRQIFEGYAPLLDPEAVEVSASAAAGPSSRIEVSYPVAALPLTPFSRLMASVTGGSGGADDSEGAIRRVVTIANGGYSGGEWGGG